MIILFSNIILLYNIVFVLCDVQGRLQPGCSLIKSTIYCFGGYKKIKNGSYHYTHAINEHISLDLSTVRSFQSLNISEIEWKNVSNNLNKKKIKPLKDITTVDLTDDTYLLYGSYKHLSTFIHYYPKNDSWNNLSLHETNKKYSTKPDLVNFGNNTIWCWDNSAIYLYNYQLSKWYFKGKSDQFLRYHHSTTFIKKNGLIYIMGGYSSSLVSIDFYTILIFDTSTLSWSTLKTNGDIPSNRGSHTAIASADQNYILIYGGSLISANEVTVSQDVYYVYDIFNNTFTKISSQMNTRFSHFATLYKSNYLLLVFGFQNKDQPSDSLNIIDINDVYNPIYISNQIQTSSISSSSILPTSTSVNTNNSNGVDNSMEGEKLEKTIISISVIAGIAIFAGIFFFIRYKKRKQKVHPPIEEQIIVDYRTNVDSNQNEKTYKPSSLNGYQGGRMELSLY